MNVFPAQKSFWLSRYMWGGVVLGLISAAVSGGWLLHFPSTDASWDHLPSIPFMLGAAASWAFSGLLYFFWIAKMKILRAGTLIWLAVSSLSLLLSVYFGAELLLLSVFVVGFIGAAIVVSAFTYIAQIKTQDIGLAIAFALVSMVLRVFMSPQSYAIPDGGHLTLVDLFTTSYSASFIMWQTGMLLVLGNALYRSVHNKIPMPRPAKDGK